MFFHNKSEVKPFSYQQKLVTFHLPQALLNKMLKKTEEKVSPDGPIEMQEGKKEKSKENGQCMGTLSEYWL